MSYNDDWLEDIMENRRETVRKTIRSATYEELKTLGEVHFRIATDPWFARYNEFLQNHKTCRFYRAEAPGGAEIIYCREGEKGVWLIPGSAMGIIPSKGLKSLAEIVDAL